MRPNRATMTCESREARLPAGGWVNYFRSFQVLFSMVTMTRARWSKPW